MKFLATLSNVVGAFCVLAIAMIIVSIIWGLVPSDELVGKMLLSLGTVYICMLLIGGRENSRQH